MAEQTPPNTVPQGNGAADPNAPIFAPQAVYIKDVSFEAPNGPRAPADGTAPTINLNMNTTVNELGPEMRDVVLTINLQAVMVEKNSDTPLMSGFHGLFSVGGIAGAAGVSVLLAIGASPVTAAVAVVACIIAVLLKTTQDLLPYGSTSKGPAFAMPHGVVLMIGAICFILFLAEGAMLDWSAVFLAESKQLASAHSGIGYVAFACTMTIGRLSGDVVVHKVGRRRVVLLGALTAAAGLVLATWSDSWPLALVGFMLVGAGCSNVVPVMFSLIGKQTAMAEHVAIPAVSTLGYGGILLGPAIIGFIAHGSSLAVALLVLALMLVGAGLLSLTMKLGD